MPWTRQGKYFASQFIWRQNHSKLSQKKVQPINMVMIYSQDKKLKKIACPGS